MTEDKEKLSEKEGEETEEDTEGEEDDIGIFDEDLKGGDEIVEDVSDFSIGETILSSAPPVHIRHGHNLEELAGREKTEDSRWDDSGEFDDDENSGKDFYGSSSEDFYRENKNGNSLYQEGNSNSDLYNSEQGGLYSEEKSSGVYDAGKSNTKSYSEIVNNRRSSGRSMLEITGFEDKKKQEHRDTHGLIKYDEK